jgi:phage protein D
MHLPLRDVTYVLEYGTSLVEFKPTMNVANQVGSVTLRSWNRRTRRRIRETVTLQDRRIRINRDLIEMLGECNLRSEVVTRQPAFCDCNASLRALSMLLDKFKELVTATGVSIGLPDLRAGQRVRIEGVGSRFGGTYFITETTHTCDDNGYLTRFSARRESQ